MCREGFDAGLNSFVQYYGSRDADASLLMLATVGFLPATDPRIRGTVDFIQRQLMDNGLLQRYPSSRGVDGMPPGEGCFLPCTFWLVNNLALLGRLREARELWERLLDLRNDVGLLPEEYDPTARRFLGNFPQAFTHVSLLNAASYLAPDRSLQSVRLAGPSPVLRT